MSWKPCQLPAVFPCLLHPGFFWPCPVFLCLQGVPMLLPVQLCVCVTMQVEMDTCAFWFFCKIWINSTWLFNPKAIIYLWVVFFFNEYLCYCYFTVLLFTALSIKYHAKNKCNSISQTGKIVSVSKLAASAFYSYLLKAVFQNVQLVKRK